MRRLKRIYPIYWVVSLLVLAVFLVRPEFVNSHSAHPPDVLASFLLLPQAGLPLLAVGWTLTYEMYFYILFGLALLCRAPAAAVDPRRVGGRDVRARGRLRGLVGARR